MEVSALEVALRVKTPFTTARYVSSLVISELSLIIFDDDVELKLF